MNLKKFVSAVSVLAIASSMVVTSFAATTYVADPNGEVVKSDDIATTTGSGNSANNGVTATLSDVPTEGIVKVEYTVDVTYGSDLYQTYGNGRYLTTLLQGTANGKDIDILEVYAGNNKDTNPLRKQAAFKVGGGIYDKTNTSGATKITDDDTYKVFAVTLYVDLDNDKVWGSVDEVPILETEIAVDSITGIKARSSSVATVSKVTNISATPVVDKASIAYVTVDLKADGYVAPSEDTYDSTAAIEGETKSGPYYVYATTIENDTDYTLETLTYKIKTWSNSATSKTKTVSIAPGSSVAAAAYVNRTPSQLDYFTVTLN